MKNNQEARNAYIKLASLFMTQGVDPDELKKKAGLVYDIAQQNGLPLTDAQEVCGAFGKMTDEEVQQHFGVKVQFKEEQKQNYVGEQLNKMQQGPKSQDAPGGGLFNKVLRLMGLGQDQQQPQVLYGSNNLTLEEAQKQLKTLYDQSCQAGLRPPADLGPQTNIAEFIDNMSVQAEQKQQALISQLITQSEQAAQLTEGKSNLEYINTINAQLKKLGHEEKQKEYLQFATKVLSDKPHIVDIISKIQDNTTQYIELTQKYKIDTCLEKISDGLRKFDQGMEKAQQTLGKCASYIIKAAQLIHKLRIYSIEDAIAALEKIEPEAEKVVIKGKEYKVADVTNNVTKWAEQDLDINKFVKAAQGKPWEDLENGAQNLQEMSNCAKQLSQAIELVDQKSRYDTTASIVNLIKMSCAVICEICAAVFTFGKDTNVIDNLQKVFYSNEKSAQEFAQNLEKPTKELEQKVQAVQNVIEKFNQSKNQFKTEERVIDKELNQSQTQMI